MKIKIIKDHPEYKGTVEVDEERGNYLIRVGVAEKVESKKAPEKVEVKKGKEKKEK
jgi:hypothetical protein